jgi:lysophospholipase L1-like esterase
MEACPKRSTRNVALQTGICAAPSRAAFLLGCGILKSSKLREGDHLPMSEQVTLTGLRPETERWRGRASELHRVLVVLGDSIVYGAGVTYAESYPALLEGLLNRRTSETARWHVMNAGVPGDTVLHGHIRYTRDVAPFRPQAVIIAFGLNDAALTRTCFDAQRERLWRAWDDPWMRWVVRLEGLARKVLRRLGWRSGIGQVTAIRRQAGPRVRADIFERALRDLVSRVQRDGARAWLVSLTPVSPQKVSPTQRQAYADYNHLVRKVAHQSGAALLDLRDGRDVPFVPERMWADDGVHLTAFGQVWLAGEIYDCLNHEE